MRRGPKPTKSKEAKRPVARKSPKDKGARVRDLKKRLAEAQEQQAATAEILRVIASSPTDVLPIFEAIAIAATRLCAAQDSGVVRFDGALVHLMANDGFTSEERGALRAAFPRPADRTTVTGRAILTRAVAHIPDITQDPEYNASSIQGGKFVRAVLSVPMLRDGQPVGAITVTRREPALFGDAQIALLATFAHQAVIAIENVRLFNETKEALEQQKASAEILGVISSSPTDVQPVFDAIVESAARLCGAVYGAVASFDGERMRLEAARNWTPEAFDVASRIAPGPPSRAVSTGRAIIERAVVHVPDVELDLEYLPELARASGFRSVLAAPMLRDGVLLGAITVGRADPGPCSDNQIALLKTFADQAVIAIENVRLFNELQTSNRELTTALDTQTATSDILRVISRSPTDVQPVFDAIVVSAKRLLRGYSSGLTRVVGDQIELAALTSTEAAGDGALRARFPLSLQSDDPHAQAIRDRAAFNAADFQVDPRFPEAWRVIGRARGWRSGAIVPMLRDEEVLGTIAVTRREPGGFADDEIALLQTFADQAVIAIENVRLFKELEARNRDVTRSLEQQTATSEILRVISSSPTNVQPVFDMIAARAMTLCDARVGAVFRFDGELIHLVALANVSSEGAEALRSVYPMPPSRRSSTGRAVLTGNGVAVTDVFDDPEYGIAREAETSGFRSVVSVPILREGRAIGAVSVGRAEPGSFSEQQIELLKTFADQAVIAIDNVRLFTELQASNGELRTALDTQTATSDILRVISRSQTDVQPVFDAIVSSAVRLLRGYSALVTRVAGNQIELAAYTSTGAEGDAVARATYPVSLENRNSHGQAIHARRMLNIADAQTDARLPEASHAFARARGFHGQVVLPLLRHDEALGAIGVSRREPGGFTDDEVALLKTFADQAVIAIENVRLFTELQEKNKALTTAHAQVTESLEQQTATAEILRVISQSPTDSQPVFDAIATSAVRLCESTYGVVHLFDGTNIQQPIAICNVPDDQLALYQRIFPLTASLDTAMGEAVLTRRTIQVEDNLSERRYASDTEAIRPAGGRLGYA